jgi:hypothetical protein
MMPHWVMVMLFCPKFLNFKITKSQKSYHGLQIQKSDFEAGIIDSDNKNYLKN